jgi:Bifunctional DNA primase/polymerase, N-terminal
MSLNVALDFASRGYAVLPVGPNKRPWTEHGVYSASSNPSIFSRWSWTGAACAVATGEKVEVLDVDVRGADGARPLVDQGSPSACEGQDGFVTLKALGLDWDLIQTLTLCASTPSGGGHAYWKPFSGKSRTLGSGVEWFSTGKYVVVPPAPGRGWLNDLPIAEAPEELKRIVLASHTHRDAERNFPGPLMTEAIASTSQVPKPIYFLILRLMREASRQDQRRAIGLFNVVALKRSGRNNALNYAAWAFRELVEKDAIEASGACKLLVEACKANGYLKKDGEEAVRATILSGLGLSKWPEGE